MMPSEKMMEHVRDHVKWPASPMEVWQECNNMEMHTDIEESEKKDFKGWVDGLSEEMKNKKYDSPEEMLESM